MEIKGKIRIASDDECWSQSDKDNILIVMDLVEEEGCDFSKALTIDEALAFAEALKAAALARRNAR